MAIGLFFVENGCEWAVKNKCGETAIDVMRNSWKKKELVTMFKLERYRYSMMRKLRFVPSQELKDVIVSFKNERYCLDSTDDGSSKVDDFTEGTEPAADGNNSTVNIMNKFFLFYL